MKTLEEVMSQLRIVTDEQGRDAWALKNRKYDHKNKNNNRNKDNNNSNEENGNKGNANKEKIVLPVKNIERAKRR